MLSDFSVAASFGRLAFSCQDRLRNTLKAVHEAIMQHPPLPDSMAIAQAGFQSFPSVHMYGN